MLPFNASSGLMRLLISALCLVQLSSAEKQSPDTWTITQFRPGTWVENIAVRSNEDLLVTLLDRPELQLIKSYPNQSPQHSHQSNHSLVHRFPDADGLLGITEVNHDEFFVIAAKLDLANITPVPGSAVIWRVLFKSCPTCPDPDSAIVTRVARLTDSVLPNGMTTLNRRRGIVLISDSVLNHVYSLNVRTGEYRVVLRDHTMTPAPGALLPLGVNGIRMEFTENGKAFMHYVTSGRSLYARVQVDVNTGKAVGPFTPLARGQPGTVFDDFALDRRFGGAFIGANPNNEIVRVRKGGLVKVVFGGLNSTDIAGPASAQFGRTYPNRNTLYIVTSGGLAAPVNGTFTEGGKVVGMRASRFR
jgi:hypothetical protein